MTRGSAWMLAVALAASSTMPATTTSRARAAEGATAFAQQRYERGVKLYDGKKFEEALAELRASHDLAASPNSRLFIARCLRELGRLDEAAFEYADAIREATAGAETDKRYAVTRAAASAELAALQPRIGNVVLHVDAAGSALPADAKVTVGAREVPLAAVGLSLPVMPGHVTVHVEASGYVARDETLDVGAGESREVTLSLAPAKSAAAVEAPRPIAPPPSVRREATSGTATRTIGWISLGIGATGAIGFATFGLLARGKYRSLQDACGDGPCSVDRSDDVSAGRRWQTMANVSLAIGAVGITSGALILLLGGGERREPSVALGVGPMGVSLRGAF